MRKSRTDRLFPTVDRLTPKRFSPGSYNSLPVWLPERRVKGEDAENVGMDLA
jgi:hypothetical protein